MTTFRSMDEVKKTYLPIESEAEQASRMVKGEFWVWFMKLPAKKREEIKAAMMRLADSYQRKRCHILNLLGY